MENSIDLGAFVTLVSPWRLAIMACALGLCILLGVASALKAKQFKWTQILKFLAPEFNFLWMILVYIAVAFVAAVIEPSWTSQVATLSAAIMGVMILKLKEQLNFLWPALPIANWKLPFETSPVTPTVPDTKT
jgi:uncharacterized membrane-anchored protein